MANIFFVANIEDRHAVILREASQISTALTAVRTEVFSTGDGIVIHRTSPVGLRTTVRRCISRCSRFAHVDKETGNRTAFHGIIVASTGNSLWNALAALISGVARGIGEALVVIVARFSVGRTAMDGGEHHIASRRGASILAAVVTDVESCISSFAYASVGTCLRTTGVGIARLPRTIP